MTEEFDVPGPDEKDLDTTVDPDENITDENPEDDGDPEYYNSDENDEVDFAEVKAYGEQEYGEGLFGSRGYVTTYPILKQVLSYFPGHSHVYVTSTTGGTHAVGSFHYRGEAIDVGSASQSYKDQLAAWLYKYSSHITELIHSKAGNKTGWYVKNGVRRSHGYYGSKTTAAHVNHVHLAVSTVAQANALLAAVKKDAKPAPKPSPAPPFPGVLRKGSVGNSVKVLQNRLKARGYNLVADARYGDGTVNAVKKFQKFAKITQDGVVGKETWGKLWSLKIT